MRYVRRPLLAALVVSLGLLALAYAGTRADVRRSRLGRRVEDAAPVAFQLLGLRSADPSVRLEAFRRLAAMRGPKITSQLGRLLEDPDPTVSLQAVEVAGWVRDRRLVGPLLSHLRSADPVRRARAVVSLRDIGDPSAISALRPVLSDPEARVRAVAATALGQLGDRGSTPPLLRMLDGTHWERVGATWALGALRAEAAVPAVARIVDESDDLAEGVTATHALARVGGPYAGGVLCALAEKGNAHAATTLREWPSRCAQVVLSRLEVVEAPQLRRLYIDALAKAESREAVPALVRILRSGPEPEAYAAALALGRIGDRSAAAGLLAKLRSARDPWKVRGACAQSLAAMRCAEALPALRSVLRTADANLTPDVAQACAIVGRGAAVPDLLAKLKGARHDTRSRLLLALGETRDAQAVVPLLEALRDKEQDGCMAAYGLGRIDDPRSGPALLDVVTNSSFPIKTRRSGASGLHNLADPRTGEGLYRAALGEQDMDVLTTCMAALAKMDHPRYADLEVALCARPTIDPMYAEYLRLGLEPDPLPPRAAVAYCRLQRSGWWGFWFPMTEVPSPPFIPLPAASAGRRAAPAAVR